MSLLKHFSIYLFNSFPEQVCGYIWSLIIGKVFTKLKKPLKYFIYFLLFLLILLICLPLLAYLFTVDYFNIVKK